MKNVRYHIIKLSQHLLSTFEQNRVERRKDSHFYTTFLTKRSTYPKTKYNCFGFPVAVCI